MLIYAVAFLICDYALAVTRRYHTRAYHTRTYAAHKERVAAIMEQEEARLCTAVDACKTDAANAAHDMVRT